MLFLDNICSTHGLLNDYYKFFSRIQSTLLGFTNKNNGEGPQVYCVSKKDGREEVEKKLPNKYEPLFIPKRLWPFNKQIFVQ